jgi:hypothetical protein
MDEDVEMYLEILLEVLLEVHRNRTETIPHRDQWFITRDALNARKIARSATF